jgi:hypothetical protein
MFRSFVPLRLGLRRGAPRWVVAGVLVALVTQVLPAVAVAGTAGRQDHQGVAATIRVGGPAVTVTVKAPAKSARLSFSLAKAATVVASFASWTFPADGATWAYLTDKSGKRLTSLLTLDGTGPASAPPQRLAAGSYDVVVGTGSSGDSGSATVQLTHVGAIAIGGPAVRASIGKADQPELLAFTATAGTTVAAGASASTFGLTGGATIAIENAAGAVQDTPQFVGASSAVYAAATLRHSGTYYVALRPAGPGSKGTASLSLRAAEAPARAVIGGPAVRVTVARPGLPASAAFTGTAGESVGVVVDSDTFSSYDARLYVARANGVPVGPEQYLNGSRTADGPVTLPAAGSYTVVVDPGETWSPGTVKLQLIRVADVHKTAAIGGPPVRVTIGKPTQRAFVSFRAKASDSVTVDYSASTFTSSADTIALDEPSGTAVDSGGLSGASGSLGPVTLTKAGTYAVVIDPSFVGDTGSVSISITAAAGASRPFPGESKVPGSPRAPDRRKGPASGAKPSGAKPSAAKSAAAKVTDGPTFTVSYTYSARSIFYDGGPFPGGQGYDDTSTVTATWTQSPDGRVTGSAAQTGTGRNWLYDDVCIIADVGDSASSGQFSGALTAGEVATSPAADGATSYSVSPAQITTTGTQSSQSRDYDGGPCPSSESSSSGPWHGQVSLGSIQGLIPAGQTSATGHSSCGSGVSVGSPIGESIGITACSLTWTVTVPCQPPSSAASSRSWAGYVAPSIPDCKFTKVTGQWVQPAITCPKTEHDPIGVVFWVGLDGYPQDTNKTVEQTGVTEVCQQNDKTGRWEPAYDAWYEMFPCPPIYTEKTPTKDCPKSYGKDGYKFNQLHPMPGDTITATVTFKSGDLDPYELELTVSGKGAAQQSATASQPCPADNTCSRTSADWIAERLPNGAGGFYGLADFGAWRLTGGYASTAVSPGLQAVARLDPLPVEMNPSGTILAHPCDLSGANFTVKRSPC